MKRPWIGPAGLLFLAALALRVGWIVYSWSSTGATLKYDDEKLHWQLATHLVRDGWLITDDGRLAARMPLYPLFLTPFASLGPSGILVARLAQAVLGAATAVVAYRLAGRVFGRRVALVAGALVACDPFAVFFANLLLSEVLFTLLAVGLVACARRLLSAPESAAALLGLALLGPAAILTRPSAAALVPLLWVLVLVLAADRRRVRSGLLVCPVVLVVVMLPWGVRNKAALETFAWLSTNGGATLYDAQGPQADGSSNQTFLQEMPELRGLDEVTLDQSLKRLAIAHMRRHPENVLCLAGVKFLRTWSLTPNVEEYRGGATAVVSAAFTLVVLVGAVIGLARTLRTSRAADTAATPGARGFHALLWLPVVYFTLLHCVYIGSVRYRVPLMPFVEIAAATACAHRASRGNNPPRVTVRAASAPA